MSEWFARVLYAKHVSRKRKTWQDGFVSINEDQHRQSAKLYDESGQLISSIAPHKLQAPALHTTVNAIHVMHCIALPAIADLNHGLKSAQTYLKHDLHYKGNHSEWCGQASLCGS